MYRDAQSIKGQRKSLRLNMECSMTISDVQPSAPSRIRRFYRRSTNFLSALYGLLTIRRIRNHINQTDWESFLVVWGPRSPFFLVGLMLFIAFARHLMVIPIVERYHLRVGATNEAMFFILLVCVLLVFTLYPSLQFGQVLARNVLDSSGKARDDNTSRIPGWAFSFIFLFRVFVSGVHFFTGIELNAWWFLAWSDWPEWLVLLGIVIGNLFLLEMKAWAYTRITARAFGIGDSGLTTQQAHHAALADSVDPGALTPHA
jgi:hypothetical protein